MYTSKIKRIQTWTLAMTCNCPHFDYLHRPCRLAFSRLIHGQVWAYLLELILAGNLNASPCLGRERKLSMYISWMGMGAPCLLTPESKNTSYTIVITRINVSFQYHITHYKVFIIFIWKVKAVVAKFMINFHVSISSIFAC